MEYEIDHFHLAHCDFSAHRLEFILLIINPHLSQCPSQRMKWDHYSEMLLINTAVNFHSFQSFPSWPISIIFDHISYPDHINKAFVLYIAFLYLSPPAPAMPPILLQKTCSITSCNCAKSEDMLHIILEAGTRQRISHPRPPALQGK